jgi:CheY-like chemotaxis protein
MGTVSRATVLVVDDEPDVREALIDVLERAGWEVVAARDGADALDKLRHGPRPAVILLDIMMPVMDGWQFRSLQRHDPELWDIPVVVLSANELMRGAAIDMGVDGFLKKPVKVERLISELERCAHSQ